MWVVMGYISNQSTETTDGDGCIVIVVVIESIFLCNFVTKSITESVQLYQDLNVGGDGVHI